MLQVQALEVSYGPVLALRGIDLEVAAGEIVGLVGANGAGKSTLLRAISGLVKPRGGSIQFSRIELAAMASTRIVGSGIAHVPEGRRVWPDMSVAENLQLGGVRCSNAEKESDRLESVLGLFPELRSRVKQKAGTLSGGEQQMLAIGRGLMSRPKLLMLDEPSLGLAPVVVQRLKDLFRTLRSDGLTILLSEQNARLALGATDRAYVLAEGRILASGTPRELMNNADLISAYLGERADPAV
ncbi:MAG: ABC transporter ATP-binding protein [Rhodocyclaceae bacterium]|nr:ABC transporter ATP-binding protein [Rhodocyclaceae bacterium]